MKFWIPLSLGHPCHLETFWIVLFVIRWSFKYWMALEWRRWCWNDFFSSWDDGWMTGMRKFWSKANALDFVLYHSVLFLIIFYHLTLIQCLKWTWYGFQSFHTQFLDFTIPNGCRWKMILEWPDWCWNGAYFYVEDFITLIPWSSLSFWYILKCLFCHSLVILILIDLGMKEMMLEWLFLILGW